MSNFNLMRGWQKFLGYQKNRKQIWLFLPLFVITSLMLTACQVYNGYPTATPLPTPVATVTSAAPATDIPDYPTPTPEPPFPTDTPRPPLPTIPSNINTSEAADIQSVLNNLINYYYRQLSSADIYRVGLDGLISYLKQQGVTNPQVPIPNFTGNPANDEKLFFQAYGNALVHYQKQFDEQKMAYAIFGAETDALNECNTKFYPPDQAQDYESKLRGVYAPVGIGVTVVPNANGLVIWQVIPDSPAAKKGLQMGDTILTVDGTTLKGKDFNAMAQLLRGGANPKPQTQVAIQVQRANSSQIQEFTLMRTNISTPPIESDLLNKDTGYIRINSIPFEQTNDDANAYLQQLDGAITKFNDAKVKGIVLDLRGNQDGDIILMQQVMARFSSRDPLLSFQTNSVDLASLSGDTATPTASQPISNTTLDMPNVQNVQPITLPLAVLIDQTTSGGGTTFAVGLQGEKNVQLFGNETAKCSTIISPATLRDNSLLAVAILKPLASGNTADNAVDSVTPDVNVDLDINALQQGHDTQLDKAVQYIEGS